VKITENCCRESITDDGRCQEKITKDISSSCGQRPKSTFLRDVSANKVSHASLHAKRGNRREDLQHFIPQMQSTEKSKSDDDLCISPLEEENITHLADSQEESFSALPKNPVYRISDRTRDRNITTVTRSTVIMREAKHDE